jgi:1,2-diacylglycerol-3-alpha-glucose alpha-1,2-galactosyltransferase
MTVHVVSETEFMLKGQGVHTAFVDHVELLKEKKDIDVVINAEGSGNIFHSHTYGPYFFWKGRHYKGKRIYTVHVIPDSIKGSLPLWKYWLPLVKWYFKKVYSYADICIAISPQVENAIKDLGSDTKIVRISNPVPVERWKFSEQKRKKGREMFGYSRTDFVVLGVGQLETRKGVEDFLDVAESMPDTKFLWVGGRPFGAFTEGISKLNHRIQNASSHIKFAGLLSLEDMPYVYAASNVLLFPSYQENCPLAPLEAAACGLPVVFRDLNEYTLLYEHPFLKAKNNNEFIEIIRKLNEDREYYKENVKVSTNLIIQFDRDIIRNKLISLYYELYNKRLSA